MRSNADLGNEAVDPITLEEIKAFGVVVGKFEAGDGVVAQELNQGEVEDAGVVEFGAAHVDGEGGVVGRDGHDLDRVGAVGGEAGLGGVGDEGDAAAA